MKENSIAEKLNEIAPGIKFKNIEHMSFFEEMITAARGEHNVYRKAFFYTLGILPETRQHINSLYDFKEQLLKIEGFNEGWQTSGTLKMCRLAFNLFNCFRYNCTSPEDWQLDTRGVFTPYELFAVQDAFYMLEAIKLRYPEYTVEKNDTNDTAFLFSEETE